MATASGPIRTRRSEFFRLKLPDLTGGAWEILELKFQSRLNIPEVRYVQVKKS